MSETDHHTHGRDEEGADVDGHIRRPHSLNEDTGSSSHIQDAGSDIEDDGPDVEGHGHRLVGQSES